MPTTLVAASGMSPAIITETLWALAMERPPVVPDEVIIITTEKGEAEIHAQLLTPLPSWGNQTVWNALRSEIFKLTNRPEKTACLQLAIRTIELPDLTTGIRRKAPDLRTRDHHDEAANFIIQTLAPCCDAQDNHVIVSIAGGRKTMGALLYAAMSLVGKEGDRGTHVLVNETFESCRGFFYPGQPVQTLEARPHSGNATPIRARDAVIELADIPFVPLRNKFAELDEPRRTFAGLVKAYSKADRKILQQAPVVTLDVENGVLIVEGRPLSLAGRDLLVAAFLYDQALEAKRPFLNKDKAESSLTIFMNQWKERHPFHRATVRLRDERVVIDDIPKALASLRKKLKENGLSGAIPYLTPERARIGFEIRQDKSATE